MIVERLARHRDGHWIARISAHDKAVAVDNRYGSWQTASEPRQFVLPGPALELQASLAVALRHEQELMQRRVGRRVRARLRAPAASRRA